MASLPHCHVCKKYFNTLKQRTDHETNEKHLEKVKLLEEQIKCVGIEPVSRPVNVDKVQMSTFYPVTQTVASCSNLDQVSRHSPTAGVAPYMNDLCGTPNRRLSSGSMTDRNTNSPIRSHIADGSGQDYYFDKYTERGKCFICVVDLTSAPHAQQHLSGKNHEKKKNSLRLRSAGLLSATNTESSPAALSSHIGRNSPILQTQTSGGDAICFNSDTNIIMCKLCNAPLSGELNIQQHFAGAKHKKELRKRGLDQNMSFMQNTLANDPEQTRKMEFVQSNVVQNSMTPDENMIPPRIQPELAREQCVSPQSTGLDTIAGASYAGDQVNPLPVQRSFSHNLSEYNDKITHLKDKKMLLEINADPQQSSTPPTSSNMPSILDNNQQPVFKTNATSPVTVAGALNRDMQTAYSAAHDASNRHAIQNNPVMLETGPPIQNTSTRGRPKPYEFDGTKGYCNVCDVELTSYKLAQQHINGNPHRKKWATWEAMQQTLPEKLFRPTPQRPDTNASHILDQSTTRTPSEGFYHFDGRQGFCRACNSPLTSPDQANQHFEGKQHKRNVQRLKMTEQGICYPLHCEVCDKSFTGQESATQHFISDKHKQKEDLVNGDVLEVFEGGKRIRINGAIWYACTVCNKPLNTLDQFNIHRRSHEVPKGQLSRGSSVPAFAFDGTTGNVGALGSPGVDGREFEQYQSRQNSRESSIDSQVPLAQIQALLAFGENPVVNTEFRYTTDEAGGSRHSGGSGQIKGQGDFSVQVQSSTNSWPAAERNAHDHFLGGARDIDRSSFTKNMISPDDNNGSLGTQSSMQNHLQSHGSGFQTTGSGVSSERSGNTSSREDRKWANNSDDTVRADDDDNNREGGIFTNQENSAFFGKVTIGAKPSPNRNTGTRDSGQKNIVSLDKSEIDDSSGDDDDDGNDCSDTVMNIQGEERQPMHEPLSQPTISAMASEIGAGARKKYYCDLCHMQMNAKKSYKEHMSGKTHQWNLSNSKAVSQHYQASIYKSVTLDLDDLDRAYNITDNVPRTYQISLMKKAMASDSVVYLPTGTGKTMVSVLTIGLMMEKNPSRPVIFLVDKVLLVIQQARYIKTELGGKKFKRTPLQSTVADGENVEIVERELSLAFVCGGLLCINNIPLWQHDIIVTTAAYCINLLDNGAIRWADFSLAVLDEVHHCGKKHPYHKLIQDYHCQLENPRMRPKILGLTASPAGKNSVEATYKMLQTLLKELGGANIAFVDEDCRQELDRYQSNTILRAICVPLNDKEQHFMSQSINYFLRCYMKLAPLSPSLRDNRDAPCSYFYDILNRPDEETLQRMTDMLLRDDAPLQDILPFIFEAQCGKNAEDNEKQIYESLRSHTFQVLLLITDIPTGLNFGEVKKKFQEGESNYELSHIKELGLPLDIFYKQILTFEQEEGNGETAMIGRLIQILQDQYYIDWSKGSSKALVLVRERKQAKSLARSLKHKAFFINNALQVTHLVGHGKGNEVKGMAVKDQKKVLDNQERYDIIVATSIAEEGVDINTVELVVSMNPPSNVTALVQMRGRARKKGSHFIILCSSQDEVTKLEELRQHENNMLEAARLCQRQHNQ